MQDGVVGDIPLAVVQHIATVASIASFSNR